MYLNGRLISALLLVRSKSEAHLAISAFCPEHAQHSPSKLHIYLAAQALAGTGIAVMDLTPGGDPWKARFGTQDRTVWDLTVYPTQWPATMMRAKGSLTNLARVALEGLGLPVGAVKEMFEVARKRRAALRGRNQPHERAFRLEGTPDPKLVQTHGGESVSVNSLGDLINLGAKLTRPERGTFLAKALFRIERGDRCYFAGDTARDDYCLGWMVRQSQSGEPFQVGAPTQAIILEGFMPSQGAKAGTIAACLGAMVKALDVDDAVSHPVIAVVLSDQKELQAAAARIGFRPSNDDIGARAGPRPAVPPSSHGSTVSEDAF